tara:strand:+ start:2563 stop:2865 length:303 start_codon:yes stop_codon:yes gene_type:complete
METILTVLITLGVVGLMSTVVGVVRLNRRVNDLDVTRLGLDDEICRLRKELEDDVEHLHREMTRIDESNTRNLDRRLDNLWSEHHKLEKSYKNLVEKVLK